MVSHRRNLKFRKLVIMTIACSFCAFSILASEDTDSYERDNAEVTAKDYLRDFGQKEYRKLYKEYLGKRYKSTATEEAFVAQYSMIGRQLGGPGSGRRLIDEKSLRELPGPEGVISGTFYWFRYRTQYPAGNVYEDVYLEFEEEGMVCCWMLDQSST